MSKGKVRFGMVGAGSIAQTYIQAFENCEVAELIAIADIRPEALACFREAFPYQSYDSYMAMAEGVKLDAVIICTPPVTHPEICDYFLEKQINVLCEKPLCIDSHSARNLFATAKRVGVQLTMASKFRYVEDVVHAKSLVASGILGEIILWENAFTSRIDMSSRWNANPEVSGGGVLIDNGTHSLDLMRYFVGPLEAINVVEGKRIQGLPVEETVHLFVRSACGVIGSIDLSWSISKPLDYYLRIYGTQGMISVGWQESKYRLASNGDWLVFGKGYHKLQAFCSQITNFSLALQGEESLLTSAEDALACVEAIETAYKAMQKSFWGKIES